MEIGGAGSMRRIRWRELAAGRASGRADLLQFDFTVDRYALRGKPRREVVTIGDPYNRRCTGRR